MVGKQRFISILSVIFLTATLLPAQPVLTILPVQQTEIIEEYNALMLEDLFIAELTASQWFQIREDRADKEIRSEQALQGSGLTASSNGKYSRPDADFVTELLVTKQSEEIFIYARAWAAQDGSALFSLKKKLTALTIESDIKDLGRDFSFSLSELTGPSAAGSTTALLSLGYYREAESVIHARYLNEGDSLLLNSDLKELQKIRIRLIKKEIYTVLKEEEAQQSLYLLNDLARLDPGGSYLPEMTIRVRELLDRKLQEEGNDLYKEALKLYKNGEMQSAERNRNRLAIEYILSDAAADLPVLSEDYHELLSSQSEDLAALSLEQAINAETSGEARRLLLVSKGSVSTALLEDPDYENGLKELRKIGQVEIELQEREKEQYSSGEIWQEAAQPSRYIWALGYSRSFYIEPDASSEIDDSSQFGLEASVIRTFPYSGFRAFSLSPGLKIQKGSGSGRGGDSEWEGSSFMTWILVDAGMDYNFRKFRLGFGPHLRFGMGNEKENWDQNGEQSDLVFASAWGGQFRVSALPLESIGVDLMTRMVVINRSHHPRSFQTEIIFRINLDIDRLIH